MSYNGDDLFNVVDETPGPTDPAASYDKDLMLKAWRKEHASPVPRTPERGTRNDIQSTCSTHDEYSVSPAGFLLSALSFDPSAPSFDPTAYVSLPEMPFYDDSMSNGFLPGEIPSWPFEMEMDSMPAVSQDAGIVKIREGQARKQVEFYFSPQNIGRDTFLRSKMDHDGWVSLQEIVQFPRVSRIGFDAQGVAASLLGSKIVEVSWDSPPCVRMRHASDREAYPRVEPAPLPSTLDANAEAYWPEDGTPYDNGLGQWPVNPTEPMENLAYNFDYGCEYSPEAATSPSEGGAARASRGRRRARRGLGKA